MTVYKCGVFDLLQNDSSLDENGVAYNILPLATAFCRVSHSCSLGGRGEGGRGG